MFLVSMADIISDAVRAVAVAKRREYKNNPAMFQSAPTAVIL
jgi:hypothetical protein